MQIGKLADSGFQQGEASICKIAIYERLFCDDVMCVGATKQLNWFRIKLVAYFKTKVEVLGDGEGEVNEVEYLNRIIRRINQVYAYEDDSKPAEILATRLQDNLNTGRLATKTGSKDEQVDVNNETMSGNEATV